MRLPRKFDVLIFIKDNRGASKDEIRHKFMLTLRQYDEIIEELKNSLIVRKYSGVYKLTNKGIEVYSAIVNLRMSLQ